MSLPTPAFSFRYDGRPSSELLPTWSPGDGGCWADPGTGLTVTLTSESRPEWNAVEWVLTFENTGTEDTPVLDRVLPLDGRWAITPSQYERPKVLLGRSRGSRFAPNDFEYQEDALLPDETISMVAGNGRPSQNWLPFFLLDQGGFGSFLAIGWSGQWAMSLTHHRDGDLEVTAGLELFASYLKPGEKIRTPRILQLDWSGDRDDAHNSLRRYLREHHTPRQGGEPLMGPFSMAAWGGMNSAEQIRRIELYEREQVRQEYFWLDAGWYGADSSYSADEFEGDWSDYVGDWTVNRHRHPDGLLPIREAAAKAGMKFLLWAEPGRAIESTPLVVDHPEWYLGDGRERLLDFGRTEARDGAVEVFSRLIAENSVDVFREDYNVDPLPFWRAADQPGRVGIVESHYVEGFYFYWDELLRRHPGLIIDNCASGGRRIELETIGRSVALWRSDWQCFPDADPAAAQTNGMGLGMWVPMHGTGVWSSLATPEKFDVYRLRSYYSPAFQMSAFVRETEPAVDDYPWSDFRRLSDEYLRVRPFFGGDYYPLTGSKNLAGQTMLAYQLDDPAESAGVVLAFRRTDALANSLAVRVRGLTATATYEVESADTGEVVALSGDALAQGFEISLPRPGSSALFFYRLLR